MPRRLSRLWDWQRPDGGMLHHLQTQGEQLDPAFRRLQPFGSRLIRSGKASDEVGFVDAIEHSMNKLTSTAPESSAIWGALRPGSPAHAWDVVHEDGGEFLRTLCAAAYGRVKPSDLRAADELCPVCQQLACSSESEERAGPVEEGCNSGAASAV